MFDIGDHVWVSSWDKEQHWDVCPHCRGEKYLTIIMGDGERVSIDCSCCIDLWKSSQKLIEIMTYLDSLGRAK